MSRFLLLILAVFLPCVVPQAKAAPKPNIVVILADDLGYGDLGCYNKASKIPTPNLDRLASEGLRFTDAHSPSSVCSPTRYALLTGRYAWRTRLQTAVLGPWGKPLISPGRMTVASLLKQHGYSTACIGKWHLGWDWPTKDGNPAANGPDNLSNVDFSKPIANGPITCGFDTYFGVDLPNYPPFCFIDQDRTVGIPTVPFTTRKGPSLPGWDWVRQVRPASGGLGSDRRPHRRRKRQIGRTRLVPTATRIQTPSTAGRTLQPARRSLTTRQPVRQPSGIGRAAQQVA